MAISENVYIMGCSEIDRQEWCHTQSTAAASITKLRAKNIDGGGRALKQISIYLPKKEKGDNASLNKKTRLMKASNRRQMGEDGALTTVNHDLQ